MTSSLNAIHFRHAHIHEHHIRTLFQGYRNGLGPRAGLTHHSQVRLGIDQHLETPPEQRLIVGNDYPDHETS
ncbi:hypothetical protein SAMN05444920_101257 [Nonomuraea solani]|uniref:Uncharacterized protein n=1 Tax=Nonomuraea solani TaxID=1144553 RepID=A0A1H5TLK2_9ACTN|nr:hypothetical protein SAMN05444920_101257 [Nonomuraea solani]